MEVKQTNSQPSTAAASSAADATAPQLNYAPPRRFGRLRRWIGPGSAGFFALVLMLAGAGMWGAWKWRLKADERAFNERAMVVAGLGRISFTRPPNVAALRHLARLPCPSIVVFDFDGSTENSAVRAYREGRWPKTIFLSFGPEVDVDAWLSELARPDSGLKALASLDLRYTSVTDAGLKALARPDSGLKGLATLDLFGTQVTDAGLKELARPDGGLKGLATLHLGGTQVTDAGLKELAHPDSGLNRLATLYLYNTQVTDAGLKELARPDGGLKGLATLNLGGTRVTDAGVAALKAARPGLKVYP